MPGAEGESSEAGQWIRQVDWAAVTAADTRQMVLSAVAGRLAESQEPIVVITDHLLPLDPRIIQLAPDRSCEDAGITHVAAGTRPSAQAMVTIRNQSPQTSAELVISSGAERLAKMIGLPPRGQQRNYFFDLPRLDALVSAELRVHDDVDADKSAWLVREGSSPRLEPRPGLPSELRRIIAAYHAVRPPSDASTPVAVVSELQDLPADAPAIVLQAGTDVIARAQPQVADHSVTHHVHWDRLPERIRVPSQAPAGWQSLVSLGGHPLVAIHPDGSRQVWVGLNDPGWAATPDFVVFWTNVFEWIGGGDEHLAAHDLREWGPQWKPLGSTPGQTGFWPGLYQRSDGATRAFNAPDVMLPPPPHVDWRAKFAGLGRRAGKREVTAPLILSALACLAAAAALWRRATRLSKVQLAVGTVAAAQADRAWPDSGGRGSRRAEASRH